LFFGPWCFIASSRLREYHGRGLQIRRLCPEQVSLPGQPLACPAGSKPGHLVLRLCNLAFLASAASRVLIFAKQKTGSGVVVYLIPLRESSWGSS
jgi:hypothetical protein